MSQKIRFNLVLSATTCQEHDEAPVCKCGMNAVCIRCGNGRGSYPCECNVQSWWWTPEWQAKEAEAEADLREGRFKEFNSSDEFIRFLDSETHNNLLSESLRRFKNIWKALAKR
jgi:hypothetical protein